MQSKIAELLHQYFELGVAEGREGRNHDTEAGDAQRVLSEIEAEIAALSAAEPFKTAFEVASKHIPEARISLLSRAIRQGLNDYGWKNFGTLPEVLMGYIVQAERAEEAAHPQKPRDCGHEGGNLSERRDNIGSAYTRSALSAQVQDANEQRTETCQRCQGNGEIVTDWERYRHPHENDVGDEAVAECPDCDGIGKVAAQVQDVAGWQPIESATEESSEPYICYSPGNPRAQNEYARDPHYHIDGFSERWPRGRNQYPESPYTHWMPLPAAPAKQEGGHE